MALDGASSSASKSNYHVFLSFRGEDTRHRFTDHLYAALQRSGVIAFIDSEQLERGDEISPKLNQAIEQSAFAIVVVSPNYASSSWCLNELEKILESKEMLGQEVLPVFYDVNPSDVRYQTGPFAEAFEKHETKFPKSKLEGWRDALKAIANISGWDSKRGQEAKLIEDIVELVLKKLRPKLPSDSDGLVGTDLRIKVMHSLLRMGDDVRFIGIWGMGGIGKTTLARVFYERIHSQFDISCFLFNVREDSEKYGLIHLQRELLSHLKIKGMEIHDSYEGRKMIQMALRNKKCLIVLDDVNAKNQLENLAGNQEWFGPGSRVIVTTRDMHLLTCHGIFEKYEIDLLNINESLRLFSQKVFKRDQPEEGYLELSKAIIQYTGGLPLAVNTLGVYFCGRSLHEWDDAFNRIKQFPHDDILNTLRLSYDGLQHTEKTVFLDIACFFRGWDKERVSQILKICGLYPTIGIKILTEKSLVTDDLRSLEMHDLLQEMGRDIVRQESPNDAGKRSRLWSLDDINQVLRKNKGTKLVQGIVLETSSEPYEAQWNPRAFSKLCNLRLLIILCDLHLPLGLKCLSSSLKVLEWKGFPLESLPLGVQLDELVDLKMHHSKIKQLWNGTQFLGKLKFIDLSYSEELLHSPNIYGVPKLERLVLEGCIKLEEVEQSVGQHKKLVILNLKDCINLNILPSKLETISLEDFILSGCSKVQNIPEFGENMKCLSKLLLNDCKNLVCIPNTICYLKSLKVFNISGCSAISGLPDNLNECEVLEELDLSETAIRALNSCIAHLKNLKLLSARRCINLETLPSKLEMNSLNDFILSGCSKVRNLPEFGENMKYLSVLDLEGTSIKKLPPSLAFLTGLSILNLRNCKNIVCLPSSIVHLSSLSFLDISGCSGFRTLPKISEEFHFSETAISKVPTSIERLNNLENLSISLAQKQPHSLFFPNLSCLTELSLRDCNLEDETIPDGLSFLSSLWRLDLSGSNFVHLPAHCIANLPKLYDIFLCNCPRLQSLPVLPPNVRGLFASDCAEMKPSLDPQKLWKLFKSRNDQMEDWPKFWKWLLLPGSEIPAWFENQNYFPLDPHLSQYDSMTSIIADIPDYCLVSKWWGIAVCLTLEPVVSPLVRQGCINVAWNCKDPNPEAEFPRGVFYTYEIWEFQNHHLFIIFLEGNHEIIKQYLRCGQNQIQLIFYARNLSKHGKLKISKCGCRVVCKEDVQVRWHKAMNEIEIPSNFKDSSDLNNSKVIEITHDKQHRDEYEGEEYATASNVEANPEPAAQRRKLH